MRSCDIHDIYEFLIHRRLMVPCIYDYGSHLRCRLQQSFLIDNLSPCGIYEYGSRLHQCKEIGVCHSPCVFIQRHVQGNDVRLGQKMFQRTESLGAFFLGTRRVASEDFESQIIGHILDPASYISDADYTYGRSIYLYSLPCGNAVKG